MTGAERQAAYRARWRASRDAIDEQAKEQRELKVWITGEAFRSLARLARHHGVTKREMLERVIGEGQKKALAPIRGTPAEDAYWKVF